MEQIVIYGAGNTGKSAYFYLRNRYECLFFVDGDDEKVGGYLKDWKSNHPMCWWNIKR